MATVREILDKTYDRVYFGPDPSYPLNEDDKLLFRTLQFFGLPSGTAAKDISGEESYRLSIIKILKGLAGWNSDSYTPSFNLLRALIFFPINVIITASRLALNTVKLFTEFLPLFLAKMSKKLIKELLPYVMNSEDTGTVIAVLAGIACFFLGLGYLASHALYFVGCATTSPADNLRGAFALSEWIAEKIELENPVAIKILGGFFAFISLATTACVYTILFPLAIKLLITQAPAVLPAIANGFSQFIGIFSAEAGASVAAFFTTTLPAFLSSFGAAASVSSFLSAFALSTPILGGLALLGLIVGPTAAVATRAVDELGKNAPEDDQWPEPKDFLIKHVVTPVRGFWSKNFGDNKTLDEVPLTESLNQGEDYQIN